MAGDAAIRSGRGIGRKPHRNHREAARRLDDDIFHGVVIRREDGEAVEIPARRVKRMTTAHVITDLRVDEAEHLPPYRGR